MAAQIDPELADTEKVMDQWAFERRDFPPTIACPLHNLALIKAGVVLDGPTEMSDTSMVIDKIYLTAPEYTQAVVKMWFFNDTPVPIKAKKLGIGTTMLYKHAANAMSYFRGRLHENGINV